METVYHDQSPVDNPSPNNKRRKLDTADLPPPPIGNNNADCPLMTLPIDLRAKIIAFVPIAQWHALELVDPNFREATLLAWRQRRTVSVDEFVTNAKGKNGESSMEWVTRSATSILKKMNNRSPFLTSLHGIPMQIEIPEVNLLMIASLAQFEHLTSVSLGDGSLFYDQPAEMGCPIQDATFFLETTRSRSTLTYLSIDSGHIDDDPKRRRAMAIYTRRFAELLSDDHGTKDVLKLETLDMSTCNDCTKLKFDRMDLSKMTSLSFGTSKIKTEQLTTLVSRATNLEHLSFSFVHCTNIKYNCGGNGLRDNKDLLKTIGAHEKLISICISTNYGRSNHHANCMRFEKEFLQMLEALGRRGVFDSLTLARDFISPKFDMSRVIATISTHLPRLRSLDIPVDDCTANDLQTMARMEQLEGINFGYKGDYKKFYEITDGVFAQLGAHKRLKRVRLDALAREDEHPLAELGKMSTLTDVSILHVDLVRKEEFVSWSEGHVSNLNSLTLTGVGMLDNDAEVGLIALIKKAPRLRELEVEGMITDRLLNAIAEPGGPTLRCLCVTSRRDEISIDALQMIIDRYPDLELGGMKSSVWKQLKFPRYRKATNLACPWLFEDDEEYEPEKEVDEVVDVDDEDDDDESDSSSDDSSSDGSD